MKMGNKNISGVEYSCRSRRPQLIETVNSLNITAYEEENLPSANFVPQVLRIQPVKGVVNRMSTFFNFRVLITLFLFFFCLFRAINSD